MIISHKYKFIFIKTLKTAGTSIEVELSGLCGKEDVFTTIYPPIDGHEPRNYKEWFNPFPELFTHNERGFRGTVSDLRHRNKYLRHGKAITLRSRLDKDIWKNYFKFAVDRNPFDKIVSMYFMNTANYEIRPSLEEWMLNPKKQRFMPVNHPFYCDAKGDIIVDRVLRYEALNDDLCEVLCGLGMDFKGLSVRAKGEHRANDRRSYKDLHNDVTIDLTRKIFSYEIELHDYEF